MRTKLFNSHGREVPVVGQGTWKLASKGDALEEARSALKLGLELGMTHIDTAEMYGEGLSEKVVGEVIKGFPRDQLFIVSKVIPSNASYEGTFRACERSLARLKLDYIDCYLLHWPGQFPISETMTAMEELVEQGKIRSLGLSNFDVEDLEEAQHSLRKERVACNQVLYNLEERGIERALLPYCQKRQISIVGYTPFGHKPIPAPGTKSGDALHAVARKHNATVAQVILAFLTRGDGLFTIPKASNQEHVRQNALAGDLVLDDQDISLIDDQFPAPKRRKPLAWA
jgi:diketogulonate reductase-like aldo/keto reductase